MTSTASGCGLEKITRDHGEDRERFPGGCHLPEDLAEQLVAAAKAQGLALTGPGGLLTGLTKQVLETALEVEMAEHLGHDRGDRSSSGNVRNGCSGKTVRTDIGDVRIAVPGIEPAASPRRWSRSTRAGWLGSTRRCSASMPRETTGDIANHLADIYGSEVSRDLVSRVIDAVVEQMQSWQSRPLDAVYPVLLIDAIVLKIRDGQVTNRPVYVAMGITVEGERDVLGLWVGPADGEGAKQWMSLLTELRNRGVADVCIVCCDGLKGLPEADLGNVAAGHDPNLCGAPGPQQPALRIQGALVEDHRRPAGRLLHSPRPRPGSPSSPSSGGPSTRP